MPICEERPRSVGRDARQGRRYARDTPAIRPRYARDTPAIRPRYARPTRARRCCARFHSVTPFVTKTRRSFARGGVFTGRAGVPPADPGVPPGSPNVGPMPVCEERPRLLDLSGGTPGRAGETPALPGATCICCGAPFQTVSRLSRDYPLRTHTGVFRKPRPSEAPVRPEEQRGDQREDEGVAASGDGLLRR